MSGGPLRRRGVLDRLAKSSMLALSVAVLTIVASLVGIVTFAVYAYDRWGAAAPPVPTAAATNVPSSPGGPVAGPPSPSLSAPTTTSVCLDDRQQEVDCRQPHRLEKFDGTCSTDGMLRYMSGRAGADVVLATVRPWSGACLIENPVAVAETAADALVGGNDDAWRRCLDDRQGRLVPCSEDHTGEYLATGRSHKASPEECQASAEAYMRQTLVNVADQLTVRVVAEVDPDPNAPRCLIAVRGTQPLTASVRNLGVSPVPIRR